MQFCIHQILHAWVTNTILQDCIPWKPAILILYNERIQPRSTTVTFLARVKLKGVRTFLLAKLKAKTGPSFTLDFGIQ